MKEIHSEKKAKLAIVSIIFLLGLFFGINFSNQGSNFLIKTLPYSEEEIKVVTKLDESFQEKNLIPRNSIEEEHSMNKLIELALDKINEDRLEHGLTPVKLGNNIAAQKHVDDMMAFGYLSHWNTHGVKPYVTYTEYGGLGYVKENIAASWCEGFNCKVDPVELIEQFQHLMVYDDADSNWGHRDNILDPNHSLVNIGITWNDNNFYFAQHFETKLIDFKEVNFDDNQILKISGQIQEGYKIMSASIFQDSLPLSLNGHDLESKLPYSQNFYDSGTIAGMLVKEPSLFGFYEECQKDRISISSKNEELCIPYETYKNKIDKNEFEIKADLSKLLDSNSIHTIYITLENQDGDHVIASSITLEYL